MQADLKIQYKISATITGSTLLKKNALIASLLVIGKTSSYYKVVVIKVPLQGQNATMDKVLWIGLNLLPQDGLRKAPTTALCF